MSRGTSPVLLGRDAEIERLRAAIAAMASGAAGVVLISGEAGIGKSRLLAEWEASAIADPPGDRGIRFLHASCIEVGERLAFLPILDWLQELRGTEPDVAPAAEELLVAFGGSDRGWSDPLPSTGEPSETNRATRFTGLRNLLVNLAREHDVVAVIDDLHWADRSTLDVVTFLARRLAATGVLLAAAFRSDELHRRHPLTTPLADLERHSMLEHVRLEPLQPDDIARQIVAIEGERDDPARTARVVELADGNPFHVEELLALDRPGPLPFTLRDVLASRLAEVDDATMAVLREAAVIGRRVDADLLIAVSRDGRPAVETALRSASEARILVAAEDGRRIRFRHALLREAVYDEVLPGDRVELHRRIAVGLTDRPDLGDPSPATASAELARHWLAAGEVGEAFVALLRSARTQASAYAWAEARWALEEALGLWDRVPDADTQAGRPRSEIFGDAAAYAWYQGDSRRALELNHRAQREPDVAGDPARLGMLLVREAWYHSDLGDSAASLAAVERAVAIIPADPPSEQRALAVGTLGIAIAAGGRVAEGIGWLEESTRIATRVGDRSGAAGELAFLGPLYAMLGREADAIAAITEARRTVEMTRETRDMDDVAFAFSSNEPWVWLELGREEAAIAAVEALFVDTRLRGTEASMGAWLVAPLVMAQFRLGRWDSALVSMAAASMYDPTLGPVAFAHAVRASILAGRGDVAEARLVVGRAIAARRAGWLDEEVAVRVAAAWIELMAGSPDAAAAPIEAAIERLPTDEATTLRAELAWLAAWIAADSASHSRRDQSRIDRFDRLTEFSRRVVSDPGVGDDVAARSGRLGGIERWRRMAAAELDRRDGRDDPERWSLLAAELEAIDNNTLAAIARLREGAARLASAEAPDAVRAALHQALAHADRMNATVLLDQARAIARAGRIELDATLEPAATATGASISGSDPWGLSRREREVLRLLAEGRTNVQIGQALYISDKTASVHVTHILDKLGVDSRVEAALLAVRVGFVAPVDAAD